MRISDWSSDVCSSDLEILPLHINGGIVLDQFVLAAGEAGENGPDVALRAFVAVEIIAQLAAKRNDAEQLLLAEQIALAAGIKVFNSASQFRQISADAVVRSEEHTSELQSLMRISYA